MNSQSKRLKPWLRAIAIVTAIAVTTTSVADANQLNLPAPEIAVADSLPRVAIDIFDNLDLPSSIGTVKKIYRGSRPGFVVHIQDAHVNEEAQRNIGKIIQYFSKNNDLNLVNLEGGTGEIATNLFSFFPDQDVRKEVSDYYLKEGRLSGAEYLAVVEEPTLTLNGIEDPELYQQNKTAYLDALNFKARDEKVLEELDVILKKVARHAFSEELYALTIQRENFQDDGKNLLSYARYLTSLAEQKEVTLEDYQGIQNLIAMVDLEKEIDFEKAEKEITTFGDDLKNLLSADQLPIYLTHSLQYERKEISRRDYFNYLEMQFKSLAETLEGKSLTSKYSHLLKYLRYMQLYDTINVEVFDELDRLETSLKNKMFSSQEEEQLDHLIRTHLILEKMFDFSLTKQDADYFYAHREQFKSAQFKEILSPLLTKYRFSSALPGDLSVLDEDLPRVEKFYQFALQRDHVLIENAVRKMESEKAAISAIVTGGFHTAGIERYLADKDYSYVVVMPSIAGGIDSKKEADTYQSALTEKPLPVEQALALALPSSKSARVNDPRFQLAAKLLLALDGQAIDENPSAKAYWMTLAVANAIKLRGLDEAIAVMTEELVKVNDKERVILEVLIAQLLEGKYVESLAKKDNASLVQQIYIRNGDNYTVFEITPAKADVSEMAQVVGANALVAAFVYGEHNVAIYQVDAVSVTKRFEEVTPSEVFDPSALENEAALAINSLDELTSALTTLLATNVDDQLDLATRMNVQSLFEEIADIKNVEKLTALALQLFDLKRSKAHFGELSERLQEVVDYIIEQVNVGSNATLGEATRRWKTDKLDVRPRLLETRDYLGKLIPIASPQMRAELRAVNDQAQLRIEEADAFFAGLASQEETAPVVSVPTEPTQRVFKPVTPSVEKTSAVISKTSEKAGRFETLLGRISTLWQSLISFGKTKIASAQNLFIQTFLTIKQNLKTMRRNTVKGLWQAVDGIRYWSTYRFYQFLDLMDDFKHMGFSALTASLEFVKIFRVGVKARKSVDERVPALEKLEQRFALSGSSLGALVSAVPGADVAGPTAIPMEEILLASRALEFDDMATTPYAGPMGFGSMMVDGETVVEDFGVEAVEQPNFVVGDSVVIERDALTGSPTTVLEQLKFQDGTEGFHILLRDEQGVFAETVQVALEKDQFLKINDFTLIGDGENQELRFFIYDAVDEIIGIVIVKDFNTENPIVDIHFKGGGGVSAPGIGPIASEASRGTASPNFGFNGGGGVSATAGAGPRASYDFFYISYAEKVDDTEYLLRRYEFKIPAVDDAPSPYKSIQMFRKGNKLLFKYKSETLLSYELKPEEVLNLEKDVIFKLGEEGLEILILDSETGEVRVSETVPYSKFDDKKEPLSEAEKSSFAETTYTYSLGNGIVVEVVVYTQKIGDEVVILLQRVIVKVNGKVVANVIAEASAAISPESLPIAVQYDVANGKITIVNMEGGREVIDVKTATTQTIKREDIDVAIAEEFSEETTGEDAAVRNELRSFGEPSRRDLLKLLFAGAAAGLVGGPAQVLAQVTQSDSDFLKLLDIFNRTKLSGMPALTEKEVKDYASAMIGQTFKIDYIHHSTEKDLARMIPEENERKRLITTAERMMAQLGFPLPTQATLPENDTMSAIDWATQFLAPVILELDISPEDREDFLLRFERGLSATLTGLNFEKSMNHEKLLAVFGHISKLGYRVELSTSDQNEILDAPIANFTEDSQVKEMYRPMVGNVSMFNWVQLNKRWKELGMADQTGLKMNLDTLLGVALNYSMQGQPRLFFESIYITGNHQLYESPNLMRMVGLILKEQGKRINRGLFSLASSEYAWHEGSSWKGEYNQRVEQLSHWLRGKGETEAMPIFKYLEGSESLASRGVNSLDLANGIGLAILQLSALWKQKVIDPKTGRGPMTGFELIGTSDFDIFAQVDWLLGYFLNPKVLPSAYQDLYADSYDPVIKKIWEDLNSGALKLGSISRETVFAIVLDSDGKGPSKLSPDQQWDIHRLRKIAESIDPKEKELLRYFHFEVLKVIIGQEMGRVMTWIRFGLEEELIKVARDPKTNEFMLDMTAFDNRLQLMKQIKPYVEGFIGKPLNLNYTEDIGLLSGMVENVERYLKTHREAKTRFDAIDLRVRFLSEVQKKPENAGKVEMQRQLQSLVDKARKDLAKATDDYEKSKVVIETFPQVFSFILLSASTKPGIETAAKAFIGDYQKLSTELRSPLLSEQYDQAQRFLAEVKSLPRDATLFTVQADVQEILNLLGDDRPFNLLDLDSGSEMIGFLMSWVVGRLGLDWDGTAEQAALLKQALQGVTDKDGVLVGDDPDKRMVMIVDEVNAYYQAMWTAINPALKAGDFPKIPYDFRSMTMDQKGQVMSFLLEADKGWTPQIQRSRFIAENYFNEYTKDPERKALHKALQEASGYYRDLHSVSSIWPYQKEGLTIENLRRDRKARGDFLAYLYLMYDVEPESRKRDFAVKIQTQQRNELRTQKVDDLSVLSRRRFLAYLSAGVAAVGATMAETALGQEAQLLTPDVAVTPGATLSVPSALAVSERVGPQAPLYLAQLDQIGDAGLSAPTPFRALQADLENKNFSAEVLSKMREIYRDAELRKEHLWNSFILDKALSGVSQLGNYDLTKESDREALRKEFENVTESPYYWINIDKRIGEDTYFRGFFQVWARVRVEEGLAQSNDLMANIAAILFDAEKKSQLLAEVQKLTDFRLGAGVLTIDEKSLAKADIQGLVIGWIQFRIGFYAKDINKSWEKTEGVADEVIRTIRAIQSDDSARDLFNQTIGKMFFLDQGSSPEEAAVAAEKEVKDFSFFTQPNNKEAMEFMLSITAMLVVDFRKSTIKAEDSLSQPARMAHHTANFWHMMARESDNVKSFYNGINRGGTPLDLKSTERRDRRSAYGEFAAMARMMEDIYSSFDLTADQLSDGMTKLVGVQNAALKSWKQLEDSEIAYYFRLFYLGRRNGERLEGNPNVTFSDIVSIEDFFSMIQSLIEMRQKAGVTLLEAERKKMGNAPKWLDEKGQQSLIDFIDWKADAPNNKGLKDVPILAEEAISRVIQILVQQKELPANERKTPAEIKKIAEKIMESELYLQAVYMTYHTVKKGDAEIPVRMPRGDLSPFLDEIEAALLEYPGEDVYLQVRDRIARIFKYEGIFASKVRKELLARTTVSIEKLTGKPFTNVKDLKDKMFHVRESASFGKASYIVKLQDKGQLGLSSGAVEEFLNDWIRDVAAIEAVSYVYNDAYILPFISVDSAVDQFRNGEKRLVDANGNDHNGGFNRVIGKFTSEVKDGHDLGYKNMGEDLNHKRFFRDVYFSIYRSIPDESDEAWWLAKLKQLADELRQSGIYTQGEIRMYQQDFIGGMFTARNQFLEILGQPLYSQNSELENFEETYAKELRRYEEVIAGALIRNLVRSRGRAEKIEMLHEKIQALERVFNPVIEKIKIKRKERIAEYQKDFNEGAKRVEVGNEIMQVLRAEVESLNKDPDAFSLSTDKVSYLIGKMQEMGYTIDDALLRVVILPEVLGTSIFKEVFPDFVIEGGKIAAMTEPIFRSYGITDPELQAEIETGLRIEVDRLRETLGRDSVDELHSVWDVIEDHLNQLRKRLELTREVQELLAGDQAISMQTFGLASRIASDTLAGGLTNDDLQDAEKVSREVLAISQELGVTVPMRKIRFLTDLILKHGIADLYVTPPLNASQAEVLKTETRAVFDQIFEGIPKEFYEAPTILSTIANRVYSKAEFEEVAREEMIRNALAKRIHPFDVQKLFDDAYQKYLEIEEGIRQEKEGGLYDADFQNIAGDGVSFWDVLVYFDMNQPDVKKQIGLEEILFSHRDINGVSKKGMTGADHLRFLKKVSTAYIKVYRRAQQKYFKQGQAGSNLSLYRVFSWAAAWTLLTSLFKLRELRDESKHLIPKDSPIAKTGWHSVSSSLLNIFTYNALANFWRNFLLIGFASTLFYTANTSFLPVIGVVILLSHFLYYITPRGVLNALLVYSHIVVMTSVLFLAFNLKAFGLTAVLTYLTGLLNYPVVLIVLALHVALLITTSPWFQKKFGDGHSGVFESESILEDVTNLGEGKYTERNPLAYNPRKDRAVKFLDKKHAEIRPWLPDFSGTYEDFLDKLREVIQGQFKSFNGNMDVNFKAALFLNGGLFNLEEIADPNEPGKTIFRVKDLDAKAADFKKEKDENKKSITYRQLYQAIHDMRITVLNEAMDTAEKDDQVTFSDEERSEALTYFKDAEGNNVAWENNMLVIVTPGARKPYHLMRWIRWLAWGEDGTEGKTFGELEYKYRTDLYKKAVAAGETPSKEAWNPDDFKPWKFTLLGHTFHFGIPALARRQALEAGGEAQKNYWISPTIFLTPFFSGIVSSGQDGKINFVPWNEAQKLDSIQDFVNVVPGEATYESTGYADDNNSFFPAMGLYLLKIIETTTLPFMLFQGSISYFLPFADQGAVSLYSFSGWIAHLGGWFHQVANALVAAFIRVFGKYWGKLVDLVKIFSPTKIFVLGPYTSRILMLSGAGIRALNTAINALAEGEPLRQKQVDQSMDKVTNSFNSEDEQTGATSTDQESMWAWMRANWKKYKNSPDSPLKKWIYSDAPFDPVTAGPLGEYYDFVASQELPSSRRQANVLVQAPRALWYLIMDDREASGVGDFFKAFKWIANDAFSQYLEHVKVFARVVHTKFFAKMVTFSYFSNIVFAAYLLVFTGFGLGAGFIMIMYVMAAWAYTAMIMSALILVKFVSVMFQRAGQLPDFKMNGKLYRVEGAFGFFVGALNGVAAVALAYVTAIAYWVFFGVTVSVPFLWVVGFFTALGIVVGVIPVPSASKNENLFNVVKTLKQFALLPVSLVYSFFVDAIQMLGELVLSGPIYMTNLVTDIKPKIDQYILTRRAIYYGEAPPVNAPPNVPETETNAIWKYRHLVTTSAVGLSLLLPFLGYKVFVFSPIILAVLGLVLGSYGTYLHFSKTMYANLLNTTLQRVEAAQAVEVASLQKLGMAKYLPQYWDLMARVALGTVLSKTKNWLFQSSILFVMSVVSYPLGFIRDIRDYNRVKKTGIKPNMILKNRDWVLADFGRMFFVSMFPIVALPLAGLFAPLLMKPFVFNVVLLGSTILIPFAVSMFSHFFVGYHFGQRLTPIIHWSIGGISLVVGVAMHLPGLQMYFGPIVELFRNMLFAASSTVSGIGTSSVVNGFGMSMSVDSRYVIYNAVLLAGQLGITIAAVLLAVKHTVFNVLLSRKASKEDKREGLIFLTVFSTAVFVLGAAIAELNRREAALEQSDSTSLVAPDVAAKIGTLDAIVAAPITYDWVQLGESSLSPDLEQNRQAYISGMTAYLQIGNGLKEIEYVNSNGEIKTALVVLDKIGDNLKPTAPLQTQPLTDGMWFNLLSRNRDLSMLEQNLAYLEHQQQTYGVPVWMDVIGNKAQPSTRKSVGVEDLTGFAAQLWLAKRNLEMRASQTVDLAQREQINQLIERTENLLDEYKSTFHALVDPATGLFSRNWDVRSGQADRTSGHKDRMAVEDLYAIMILSAIYDLPDSVWKNAPFHVENYTDRNGKTYQVLKPYGGEAFIAGTNAAFWPIAGDSISELIKNTGNYFLDQAEQGKSAFPTPAYVGNDYVTLGGPIAEVKQESRDLVVPNAALMFAGNADVLDYVRKKFTPQVFPDTFNSNGTSTGSGATATLVLTAMQALLNVDQSKGKETVSPASKATLETIEENVKTLAERIESPKVVEKPTQPRSELRREVTDVPLSDALESKDAFALSVTQQSILTNYKAVTDLETTFDQAVQANKVAVMEALGLNTAMANNSGEVLIRYRKVVDREENDRNIKHLKEMVSALSEVGVKVVFFTDDDDQAKALRKALSDQNVSGFEIKLTAEIADHLAKKKAEGYNLQQALQIVTDTRLYAKQREVIEDVLKTTAVELSQNNLILLGWDEQVAGIKPYTPFELFLNTVVQAIKSQAKISQSA